MKRPKGISQLTPIRVRELCTRNFKLYHLVTGLSSRSLLSSEANHARANDTSVPVKTDDQLDL